jgi:Phosphotransferase enzyme family
VQLPWEQPDWRESVATWIDSSLGQLGIERAGAVEHLRALPWAATARVPTAEGDVYFKASAPSEAFEPALTLALAQKRPDVTPVVLQIDAEHGWMLTRDAGAQLRDLVEGPPGPSIWNELLPLYAELQIGLIDSLDELLALGTPDSRPESAAREYESLLARWKPEKAPTQAEVESLVQRLGQTIPISLVHEEFQDNNILLDDGRPTIIDWAEASVAHPFCGLVNTFRGLVDRWGFQPGDPDLIRLRDLYLEPWTRFAPLKELTELFALAYSLGMLCRALSWDRLVWELSGEARAEYAHFVPAWLEMLEETLEGKATLGT